MIAAIAFKRLGIAIAAIVLAGGALLGALALLIPADKVHSAVAAEIRSVTGLDLKLGGEASVSLFPTGAVTFAKVTLGDEREPALATDQLAVRLRFFPMLFGRIEIADVALVRPRITVSFDADGRSNWAGLIDTLARALGPATKRPDQASSFSEIRVDRGTIAVRDTLSGLDETMEDVDLALAWPSISKSFGATGRFRWHGEAVEGAVGLTDFAAALAGEKSGLKFRLHGAPLKLAFEGTMSARPTLKVDGTLAADAASLRDAFRWAGAQPISGGGFGRFALKAKTNVSGGTIALSAVNIDLDGNSAEGVLTLTPGDRRTLQGTLAAEKLDLSPYISTVRLLTADDRDWNRFPIVLDGLRSFDLDFRLSAADVTIGRAKVGRTAVALGLRGGKLTVAIGESQAFGGIIKGSFTLAAAEAGAEMKSQLQFTDVELEHCMGDMFGLRRVQGRGDMNMTLEASGSSVLGLTHTLNGTASLVSQKGALVGLNVEQLLRRLERRPLSGVGDFRTGRTPYDKLAVDLKIVNGSAIIENVQLQGPKLRLAVTGSASIPARELDLRGTAALMASTAGDAAPAFELPFMVQGPWDDPLYLPEPRALLMRSPAATPLLDAVKSRATRDTIRNAIEKLTGGGQRNSEPAASGAR